MKEPLKKIPGIVLGFLLIGTATSADMVLTNGQIYTVDDSQPWAEAVAIENGRFEYVGDADENPERICLLLSAPWSTCAPS
jgi:hypothetical protein